MFINTFPYNFNLDILTATTLSSYLPAIGIKRYCSSYLLTLRLKPLIMRTIALSTRINTFSSTFLITNVSLPLPFLTFIIHLHLHLPFPNIPLNFLNFLQPSRTFAFTALRHPPPTFHLSPKYTVSSVSHYPSLYTQRLHPLPVFLCISVFVYITTVMHCNKIFVTLLA